MYAAREHRDPGAGSSLAGWPAVAITLSTSHYAATVTLVLLRGRVLLSQSYSAKIAALCS